MSRVRVEWNGDKLVALLQEAAVAGVNDTVDRAAEEARGSHEWLNRTGQLEEEIVTEHAKPGTLQPTASFGTTRGRGFYGLFHEEGTSHEFARPFLRPAADVWFPGLAGAIRRRFRL